MPVVHIEMLEGRTLDQKRQMVQKVTEAIVETAKCPKESVTIVICEMSKDNLAKAGKLQIDN